MHEGHQQHLQKNCVFLIFVCVHFLFSCLFVQVHANVYSWECLCVGWFLPCLLYPSWWHTTCASLTFHSSSQTVPNSLFMHTSTLPSFGVDPPTSLTWPSAHETLATERRVHRILCGKKIVRKKYCPFALSKIKIEHKSSVYCVSCTACLTHPGRPHQHLHHGRRTQCFLQDVSACSQREHSLILYSSCWIKISDPSQHQMPCELQQWPLKQRRTQTEYIVYHVHDNI